ncbi:MAG: M1 family metallopeptidase [Mycobacteriaceae bacterium]|nr:M1 family metallopeptidase [Mycobacteriaceae bacterium]
MPKDSPIDPYLPLHGNRGYRVLHYDLDLEYKVASNRLAGRAEITAEATDPAERITLDFGDALAVSKVVVNGSRPAKYAHRAGKLAITVRQPISPGATFSVVVQYAGAPRPVRGPWGDIGWEELDNGALVAGQPNGAPSWFPCDDHPGSKARYRISVTTDSPYHVVANGALVRKQVKASRTTWVYEQAEPMASYLATVQIGDYELRSSGRGLIPMRAVLPAALFGEFEHDFARQPDMMAAFIRLFGPYPFADYTVVVTADDLEIPLEAQGISIFGANHCDGMRGSERLIAHELAHQWFGNSLTIGQWRDIWLHEGFACYAEWLWSEESGGASADELARAAWHTAARRRQNLCIGDPGPKDMFDDRVYQRGALTLHALRTVLGDAVFFALLREWTAVHRHSTVTTDRFIELAGRYGAGAEDGFWRRWLYEPALPDLPGSGRTRSG